VTACSVGAAAGGTHGFASLSGSSQAICLSGTGSCHSWAAVPPQTQANASFNCLGAFNLQIGAARQMTVGINGLQSLVKCTRWRLRLRNLHIRSRGCFVGAGPG
jgi:hypothetical protein